MASRLLSFHKLLDSTPILQAMFESIVNRFTIKHERSPLSIQRGGIILVIKTQIDALVSFTLHLFAISDTWFSLVSPWPLPVYEFSRRSFRTIAVIPHNSRRYHYHTHIYIIYRWSKILHIRDTNVNCILLKQNKINNLLIVRHI